MASVIYEYYKKVIDDATILVRIHPTTFEGLELIVVNESHIKKTEREFDETIYEDLDFDGFIPGSPIEFNLYLSKITE
ncbi:MAG: hypothetical protein ABFS32_04740 [Bacteroidota bacterium]